MTRNIVALTLGLMILTACGGSYEEREAAYAQELMDEYEEVFIPAFTACVESYGGRVVNPDVDYIHEIMPQIDVLATKGVGANGVKNDAPYPEHPDQVELTCVNEGSSAVYDARQ